MRGKAGLKGGRTAGRGSNAGHRGSILVAVAFLAVLFGILALATLTLQIADSEAVANHLGSTRALGVAEAGVEHAIQLLRDDPWWQAGLAGVTFPPGSGQTYDVTVDDSDHPQVTLDATGRADGFERRLLVTVEVDTGGEAPFSVRVETWREP